MQSEYSIVPHDLIEVATGEKRVDKKMDFSPMKQLEYETKLQNVKSGDLKSSLRMILNGQTLISKSTFKSKKYVIIDEKIQHLFCYKCLTKFDDRYVLFDHYSSCTDRVKNYNQYCSICKKIYKDHFRLHWLRHYEGKFLARICIELI